MTATAQAQPATSKCEWQQVAENQYQCRQCRVLLEIKGGDVAQHLARQPACGERYRNKPKVPEVIADEELARRRTICLACEDWDDELLGCMLVAEFEREKLTRYKQAKGHCARRCFGETPQW
jgi:hypothetical protein